jgi:hypothetical protein
VESIKSAMGRFAFRKYGKIGTRRGPINKALFEALVAAAMSVPDPQCLLLNKTALLDGVSELLDSDSAFYASVTYGTGKTRAVLERFGKIETLIRRIAQ